MVIKEQNPVLPGYIWHRQHYRDIYGTDNIRWYNHTGHTTTENMTRMGKVDTSDLIAGYTTNRSSKRRVVVSACKPFVWEPINHYNDVTMGSMASQITSLTIVYSAVYSGADQRKHQSSASLTFVRGIHRGPVNSPHKWPVMRKMFPFDDVIMIGPSLQWDKISVTLHTHCHILLCDPQCGMNKIPNV